MRERKRIREKRYATLNALALALAATFVCSALAWAQQFNDEGIEKDPGCFYIRTADMNQKGKGTMTVTVKSVNTAEFSDYDGERQVKLVEVQGGEGGVYVSKPQLMVSDDVDSNYLNTEKANKVDAHKIALGGMLYVEAPVGGSPPMLDVLRVPIHKTLNLNIVIPQIPVRVNGQLTGATKPAADIEDVKADVKHAQERLAQVGIKLNYDISVVGDEIPEVLTMKDGSQSTADSYVPTADVEALVDAFPKLAPNVIRVFYVGGISAGVIANGVAFPEYIPCDPKFHNICFVSDMVSQDGRVFVLAHELAHLIANEDHHLDTWNLLFWVVSVNKFEGTKRLTSEQGKKMLKYPEER